MKTVTFEEFKMYAEKRLQECYPEKEIITRMVVKNNRIIHGISIAKESISPMLHLESLYEEYEKSGNLDQTLNEMVERFEEKVGSANVALKETRKLCTLSREELAKHLVLSLVQSKNNEELLKMRIHREYLDLSILCHYQLKLDGEECVIGITHNLLERLPITEEEAFTLAYQNSCLQGTLLCFNEILGGKWVNPEDDGRQIYIAYAIEPYYGARILLNPDFLKMVADRLGGDFYILPASIHELVIIPGSSVENDEDRKFLNGMVKDVNYFEVQPEDVLSDHAYYYNAQTQKLESVAGEGLVA